MTALAVTNTFTTGATITASGHNANFSDIVTYVNNRNSGSSTWDAVYATSASIVPLIANNSTGSVNIANFQDNGTNVMTVADGGAVTITATAGGTSIPLIVDNNTSTGKIFIAKDNGTEVFSIADGGNGTFAQSLSVVGVIGAANGGVGTPSYTFGSEPGLGIYRSAARSISFASNAGERFRIEDGRCVITVALTPNGAGALSTGDGSDFWNDISYKTLTDRGCLPWADDGVELQDGSIVSDCEALASIEKHPTKMTIQGLPMLDYKTFPKVSYKKAEAKGRLLPRDKNDEPIGGQDGVEMTSVFGFMIGAIKELHGRVSSLEEK